jgi:hypothetical protein
VQFQQFLHRIENAAQRVRIWISGCLLDAAVGKKIKIEFRSYPFHDLCQM